MALVPGERVLDVGCGAGGLLLAAARAVGPGGRAVGLDLSRPLIEVARGRLEAAGLRQVDLVVGDAQVDRAPGGPFDVVASQFGVMFFDDPVAAFANLAQQVVPGGRLVFSCWQAAEANPWWVGGVLARYRVEAPPASIAAGLFSLADPDRTAGMLRAAGWAEVAHFPERRWAVLPKAALLPLDDQSLAGVPAADRPAAVAETATHLEPFWLGAAYRVPLAFQVFTARRP